MHPIPRKGRTFDKVALVVGLILWRSVEALNNGLALTPPMGFNTWGRYRCTVDCRSFPDSCINENLIIRIAEEMTHGGYLEAGYEYLVIDDCWMAETRKRNGDLQEDKTRFPSGMEYLIKYVKRLGLKFGIYENHGEATCEGYPGTIGKYVKQDAELFARWKVDFIKLDGCHTPLEENDKGYPEFGMHLNKSGWPIVYSCSWPYYQVEQGVSPNYTAVMESCNLWRNYIDIQERWTVVQHIVMHYGQQPGLAKFHGPGHWNDADMLIIGNYALSYEQSKAQMALWCVMGVPLFMSTDLMKIRPELKVILQNKLAIAINQDPLGAMGERILTENGFEIWRKRILPNKGKYYSYAIAIVNFRIDGSPKTISKTAKKLGLLHPKGYQIEDVFKPGTSDFFRSGQVVKAVIPPTGAVFWKFTPCEESKIFNLPVKCENQMTISRTYSVDYVGLIYFAGVLVMIFILTRARAIPRFQTKAVSKV